MERVLDEVSYSAADSSGETRVIDGIRTRIVPEANTALSGLYISGGTFCTQCEPEGFRRITYFLDRPDVKALFKEAIARSKVPFPASGKATLVIRSVSAKQRPRSKL